MLFLLPLLISSCGCTPSADTRVVNGLLISAPDEFAILSQTLYLILSTKEYLEEGKTQHCLTYNKVYASGTTRNAVKPETINLTCNRNLDTLMANISMPIRNVKSDRGILRDVILAINCRNLMPDSIYQFSINCLTEGGDSLSVSKSVLMSP